MDYYTQFILYRKYLFSNLKVVSTVIFTVCEPVCMACIISLLLYLQEKQIFAGAKKSKIVIPSDN